MVFWQVTIDANDPAALARFWQQALGYQPVPPADDTTWWAHYRGRAEAFDDRLFDPAGAGPAIWFQQVPEEKSGKNRLHLDLYPTGRDDALSYDQRVAIVDTRVVELLALGATVAHRNSKNPDYYVVLHDPEGNEFCVS